MKKGSRHSQETIMKISAVQRANPPMKGVHPSREVIEKIRAANLGQKRSEATKKNISAGLKRYWSSQEVRDRRWKRLKRLQVENQTYCHL